jgi:multiple sugar transport system permease protein
MSHGSAHRGRTRSRIGVVVLSIALAAAAAYFAMPLVAMVAQALSGADGDVSFAAAHENFIAAWNHPQVDFPRCLHNSAIVSILSVLGVTLTSAVVAFGFSRIVWPGRDAMFGVLIGSLLVPSTALAAPQYLVFRELGWIGTLLPLWAPAWFGGGMSIFLLRQFYRSIPHELDEAARIDGCSDLGVLCRIIAPISLPALSLVALLQFIGSWNDFLGPLLYLTSRDDYTIPLGLQMLQSQQGPTPWNLIMAACVLACAPVLLFYVLMHKRLLSAIEADASRE